MHAIVLFSKYMYTVTLSHPHHTHRWCASRDVYASEGGGGLRCGGSERFEGAGCQRPHLPTGLPRMLSATNTAWGMKINAPQKIDINFKRDVIDVVIIMQFFLKLRVWMRFFFLFSSEVVTSQARR